MGPPDLDFAFAPPPARRCVGKGEDLGARRRACEQDMRQRAAVACLPRAMAAADRIGIVLLIDGW